MPQCEVTGCGRPSKPGRISPRCERHAGFMPWLGASSAMLGVFVIVGLVLAAVALLWRVLAG